MQICKTYSRFSERRGADSGKRAPIVLIVAALALLWSGLAGAQHTTGTLRGQIFDPAGAAVSGANVTVTNDATGVSQTTVTNSAGTYDFPSVLPGTYTVAVEAKNFKKYLKKDITVLANQDNVADARLEIGAASETVEVVAGTAEVQTWHPAADAGP